MSILSQKQKVIWKDQKQIDNILSSASGLVEGPLKELASIFKDEGMMLNTDHLKGFLGDNTFRKGKTGGYFEARLIEIAQDDVDRMQIQSPRRRREIIYQASQFDRPKMAELQQDIKHKLQRLGLSIEDFNFSKTGNLTILDEFRLRVETKYSAIIESEEEEKTWNSIVGICNFYNQLEDMARKNGGKSFINETTDFHTYWIDIKQDEKGNYYTLIPNPAGFLIEKGVNV